MNQERTATLIAMSALILGLAADVLLRWIPWGLNAALFVVLFLIAAAITSRANGRKIHLFAAVAALLAALGIVWRDSPVLVGLDLALLVIFLPMLALGAREVRMAAAGLSQIGVALAATGAQALAGLPLLLASDLPWRKLPSGEATRVAGVVVRGLLIALPALLVFGALLSSADAAFAKVLGSLFDFSPAELVAHIVVTVVAAAICAGFLRSFTFGGRAPMPPRPAFLRMPAAEASIAIGLVDALFAVFVAVQFRYFFGEVTAMSHSEYARRGFFELVWVVALVMPMLLIVEWLVGRSVVFRILAAIQIALVLVIAASAYHRMQLYREEFGLTRLRFFTTAFMIWAAVLLVWFAVTVLTGNRGRFAIGALASAVAAVAVLHVINPDAIIVRTNVARAAKGERPFDYQYAMRLSDDAVDEMVKAGQVAFLYPPRPTGWRTWNVSRARATALRVERDAAQALPMP
jgi:Domain of unknown function (DUF4173)